MPVKSKDYEPTIETIQLTEDEMATLAAKPAEEAPVTKEEFLTYVKDELEPLAASFGLSVFVKETSPEVPDSSKWPAWRYHPETGEGQVYERPSDVPAGYTDVPRSFE